MGRTQEDGKDGFYIALYFNAFILIITYNFSPLRSSREGPLRGFDLHHDPSELAAARHEQEEWQHQGIQGEIQTHQDL